MATLDSSIYEVHGEKKECVDCACDMPWSYNALYETLAETEDVLQLGLHQGRRHASYGLTEVPPGTIEPVQRHSRQVRACADSGY